MKMSKHIGKLIFIIIIIIRENSYTSHMVFPNRGDFHMKHSDRHLGAKLYARKMIYCIDIEALKKNLCISKAEW